MQDNLKHNQSQILPESLKAGKNQIRTFTGKYVNPFEIRPDDIDIVDIAHSLSHQCRFAGHTQRFYSVAQHCLMVEQMVSKMTNQKHIRLEALLHDASEAYLLDIPSPYKGMMGEEYHLAENGLMIAVHEKFNLSPDFAGNYIMHEYVKKADYDALVWEWENIVIDEKIIALCMSPYSAKSMFLMKFNELI